MGEFENITARAEEVDNKLQKQIEAVQGFITDSIGLGSETNSLTDSDSNEDFIELILEILLEKKGNLNYVKSKSLTLMRIQTNK